MTDGRPRPNLWSIAGQRIARPATLRWDPLWVGECPLWEQPARQSPHPALLLQNHPIRMQPYIYTIPIDWENAIS